MGYNEDRISKYQSRWRAFLVFCAYVAWIILLIDDNKQHPGQYEHMTDDDKNGLVVMSLACPLIGGLIMGHIVGQIHIWILDTIYYRLIEALKKARARLQLRQQQKQLLQQQKAFVRQVDNMNQENETKANAENIIQSKKDLVRHLGAMDVYIRAFRTENNASERTRALQGAQSQMTQLVAKLASGEIPHEAVNDPRVREQAKETSKDLVEAKLKNDRLNRDLIRIFKLRAWW